MSIKPYLVVGAAALFLGLIIDALGVWQLVDWLAEGKDRTVIGSVLYLIAILSLSKAAWSVWQLQLLAEKALGIAEESNRGLQTRIEQAEEKLARAIDQKMLDWTPAFEELRTRLQNELGDTARLRSEELRQLYRSIHRRAERGYGPDDDTGGSPSLPPQVR